MQERTPRSAGVLVPLFSLRNESSWGIGEIADIDGFSGWLAGASHAVLQLLPVNAVSPGENSPYSSMSAFALDPIYIALRDVEDFQALGGEASLDGEARARLERVRNGPRVDYDGVRGLKNQALEASFRHFQGRELESGSRRAADFRAFLDETAEWIYDYTLFRALHECRERHWFDWEQPLRDRDAQALDEQRHALSERVLFHQYLQWQAARQWQTARRAAAARGVRLKGDLPFMVSSHSADVWAHREQFRMDATVGAPPDAFSADGQDWGLPPYDWDTMAKLDYSWLRARARRAAELFDLYRIDHVVGFYRTYIIPRNGARPRFIPGEEQDQIRLGKTILGVFQSAGSEVVAEDLGVIPDFVRATMTEMGIPGYRVLRWEKEWHQPGQPFRNPAAYPELSIAVSGTHDTETLATWWENLSREERADACRIPALGVLNPETSASFTPIVHDALLEALYGSGSRSVILPIQDVFGTHDRINLPATVGPENWTYRLPWTIGELWTSASGREAAARVTARALRHGRMLAPGGAG